ncbi:hypothetical protein NX029_26270 [Cytobacillus firmus]|nr:hypothetical protein [Cytobacillus firmus]
MVSRIETMARFAELEEVQPLAECQYCEADLFEGEDVYRDSLGALYCCARCVAFAYADAIILGE